MYDVPEEVATSGAQVQCARCENVFTAKPAEPGPVEPGPVEPKPAEPEPPAEPAPAEAPAAKTTPPEASEAKANDFVELPEKAHPAEQAEPEKTEPEKAADEALEASPLSTFAHMLSDEEKEFFENFSRETSVDDSPPPKDEAKTDEDAKPAAPEEEKQPEAQTEPEPEAALQAPLEARTGADPFDDLLAEVGDFPKVEVEKQPEADPALVDDFMMDPRQDDGDQSLADVDEAFAFDDIAFAPAEPEETTETAGMTEAAPDEPAGPEEPEDEPTGEKAPPAANKEPAAAPAPVVAKGKKPFSSRTLIGWGALAASLALVVSLSLLLREPIARALPGMADIYAFMGMPVNVRGLEFADLSHHWVKKGAVSQLDVRGEIVNITDEKKPVPEVVFAMLDANGMEFFQWTERTNANQLPPHGRARFHARIPAPADRVHQLQIRFARH